MVHGDLSPYNILAAGERLVVIDLPQVIDLVGNPAGMDFLLRDCTNVCRWFRARGLEVDEHALFGELLAARLLSRASPRRRLPGVRHSRGRVVEVDTLDDLDRRLAAGARDLAGWRLQSLDLRAHGERLASCRVAGAMFLGCRFAPGDEASLEAAGAIVFPSLPDSPRRPLPQPALHRPRALRRRPVRGEPRRPHLRLDPGATTIATRSCRRRSTTTRSTPR